MKNFIFGSLFGVLLLLGLLVMCLCSCFLLFTSSVATLFSGDTYEALDAPYVYSSGDPLSENKVLLINVEGVILNQRPIDPLTSILNSGVVYGYDIKQQFIDAAEDTSIKGIILYVNSPGGTITGSKAIADGIKYYREVTGKSVVGIGSGIVASGGYWAISDTDKIYLDSGSTIGSIGVIFGPISRYKNVVSNQEVATLDGITEEYITSGKGKDIGNPYRDLTSDERNTIQKSVDDAYNDFVLLVSESRGISEDQIRNNIGAYIYGDKQALDLKLVDQISSIDEAMGDFLVTLEIENDYQIVSKEEELDFFGSLLSISATSAGNLKAETICNKTNSALVIEESYLKSCSSN